MTIALFGLIVQYYKASADLHFRRHFTRLVLVSLCSHFQGSLKLRVSPSSILPLAALSMRSYTTVQLAVAAAAVVRATPRYNVYFDQYARVPPMG